MKTADMEFVAAEILDDVFGPSVFHEVLSEKVTAAYAAAIERYKEYGYTDDDRKDFTLRQVSNQIWYNYSGGDTCYAAGRRIIEAWGHAGLL